MMCKPKLKEASYIFVKILNIYLVCGIIDIYPKGLRRS